MLDGISNESTRQPLKERLEKLEATRQEAQQRLVAIREMEELLAVVDKGRLAYRENCTWENNRFETASRAALPYFDRAFETFGEAERYDPDSILKKLNYLPQQLRESVLVAYDEWVLVTHCSGLTKRATNIREAMPERRDTAVSRLWNQYNPTAKTKPFVQFLRQAESYRDLFAIRLAYVLIKELDASDQAAVQAAIQALNKHRHCLWSEFHMNWEVGLHYSEAEKSMKGKGKTNSRAVWATGYFQKSQASQLTSLSVIDFPNHVHIPSVVLESRIMFDNGLVTSARVLLEQCLENRPADELLTDELNRQKKLTKNSESYE